MKNIILFLLWLYNFFLAYNFLLAFTWLRFFEFWDLYFGFLRILQCFLFWFFLSDWSWCLRFFASGDTFFSFRNNGFFFINFCFFFLFIFIFGFALWFLLRLTLPLIFNRVQIINLIIVAGFHYLNCIFVFYPIIHVLFNVYTLSNLNFLKRQSLIF